MSMLLTLTVKRKCIFRGILSTLLIFQIVSATAFAQEAKFNDETSTGVEVYQQRQKKTADQGVAALADLLKRKKVISEEEAAGFIEQAACIAAGSDQGVAALAALLKNKNVISAEEAAAFTVQNLAQGTPEKDVIISSETDVNERIEELNQSVAHVSQKVAELYSGKAAELAAAAPEWSKRVRFGGDIRLRTENDRFDKNNDILIQTTNPSQITNTLSNSVRAKYRVRAGVAVDVNEQIEAVARVATGNTSNPVSTNTSVGDSMNKDNILLDLAYLKLKLKTMGEFPTVFTLYGGRMPNPWFSTDLVWDSDLNFEGLAFNLKKPLTEALTPFLTIGAFPLQRLDPASILDSSQHNKWLFGGQIGLESKNRSGIAFKLGAALYDYYNITGIMDTSGRPGLTDWSAPLFMQKGNTLMDIHSTNDCYTDTANCKLALASEFRELSLTGNLDIGFWDPVHIVLSGDYVRNRGFNKADVARRTGNPDPPKDITGYQIGLKVGHPRIEEFGQWDAYLSYKYLGADAVVDAFTDSDFHLGGTNAKGWILGTNIGLLNNVWLGLRWLTSNEISGPPAIIDVLQMDINARF